MALSLQTKKILFGILLFLSVIVIGFLLYYVFFRTPQPEEPTNVNVAPTNGLPNVNRANENRNAPVNVGPTSIPVIDTVAAGGLTAEHILTPEETIAVAPGLDASGTLRYYNAADGKFYRVLGDGTVQQMSDALFRDVQTLTWAPSTDEAILEFPDGSNIYYDFASGRRVTLPKEYTEFDFAPTSDQIAFKYMHIDPERRVLGVANPDGSNARAIEDLGYNAGRVNVDWSPTGRVIATWAEFIDLDRQELGFIGLQGENFQGTIVEGKGLQQQYSPDGQQLLYSVYSQATNYNPNLWIVDADGESIGGHRKDIALATFASKCAFHSNGQYVYCGVPTNVSDGFGLSDDFLKGSTDEIYRIDLRSGVKSRIAVPVNENGEAQAVVESMIVADDGSAIYYRDQNSGELVKIELSQ